MKWIKVSPVLAFTNLVALYGFAVGVLKAESMVSDHVMVWLTFVGVLLAWIVGQVTHQAVANQITEASAPTPTPAQPPAAS